MSKLNWKQAHFIQDVAKLITFAFDYGIVMTGGELYRTQEQQDIHLKNGATTVKHSKHQDRLAIDFNFFLILANEKLKLTYDKKFLQPLGDYWVSLREGNIWGGNWKNPEDTPHFQSK